ncbi:MAG: hypothetical protein EA402_03735 [Planctomycetota bacterium]|nr:MAG: hypothetical protein EA402_03735 [Planctomycetota bacterium]
MSRPNWNPFIVGIGIGILSWLAFGWAGKGIGMSTQVSAAASLLALPLVGSDGVADNPYWARTVLRWDYGIVFLLATGLGAFISALWSRSWVPQVVHPLWRQARGGAAWPRVIAAFVGGAIIIYGARLAGGCTSGHGITGTLQLAVSSWIFFIVMFPAGILSAWLLLGRRLNRLDHAAQAAPSTTKQPGAPS